MNLGRNYALSVRIAPRALSIYLFALWLASLACLPSFLSRTSRDQATFLGRYSLGYAALLSLFLVSLLALIALAIYSFRSSHLANLFQKLMTPVWRRPLLAWALALALVAVYIAVFNLQSSFFQQYSVQYPWLILLGIASLLFLLIAAVMAPWLAAKTPVLPFLSDAGVQFGLIGIGSLLLAVYLFGNILNMQWRMFDDGVIMTYLGADGHANLDEIPAMIASSEIGRAFSKVRYRPAFWTMIILETVAWGNNPSLYYFGRFVLLIIALGCYWWLLSRALGLLTGALVLLLALTYYFWYDIWARLGATEAFAVSGLAVYLVAFVLLWKDYQGESKSNSRRKLLLWTIYVLSGLLTIGSKENFVLLLIPNAILLIYVWRRRRLDTAALLSTLIVLAVGLFIISSVTFALVQTGTDIYQNSIQPVSRFATVFGGIRQLIENPAVSLSLAAAIASTILTASYVYLRRTPQLQKQLVARVLRFSLIAVALAMIYLAQVVFYNGLWPSDNRYDFPGRLVELLFVIAAAVFILDLIRMVTASAFAVNFARLVLLMFLLGAILLRGYSSLEARIDNNVETSRHFTGGIQTLVHALAPDPTAPIVFESHYFWDHEPVLTTAIFLRAAGIRNPFYVRVHASSTLPKLPVEFAIAQWLRDASDRGYDYNGELIFRPLASRAPDRCYSIAFSGTTSEECTFLLQIYP